MATPVMRKLLLRVGVALALALGLTWFLRRTAPETAGEPPSPDQPLPGGGASYDLTEDLSADHLRGYGDERHDATRDLALVKDVLTAFQYTIKVPDALPTAGNRDIMAALQGDNAYRIRFLDPAFDFLNAEGELEDRWGTPLYFHFVEASEPAFRSAGPDRVMWTADDVVHGEYAGELAE